MENMVNYINEARTKTAATTATITLNKRQVALILDALSQMDKNCNQVWVGRNWISRLYTDICDTAKPIMDDDLKRCCRTNDVKYHKQML